MRKEISNIQLEPIQEWTNIVPVDGYLLSIRHANTADSFTEAIFMLNAMEELQKLDLSETKWLKHLRDILISKSSMRDDNYDEVVKCTTCNDFSTVKL